MSKAAQRLNELNLINGYDVSKLAHRASLLDIYITYSPSDPFRSAAWCVISTSHKVDPDAPPLDYGMRRFLVWGQRDKQSELDKAKAWVDERYGVKEWGKIPGVFGAPWFPVEVVAHVKQLLKDAS